MKREEGRVNYERHEPPRTGDCYFFFKTNSDIINIVLRRSPKARESAQYLATTVYIVVAFLIYKLIHLLGDFFVFDKRNYI